MKIDYLSDLHADFWVKHNSNKYKWQRQTIDFLNTLFPKELGEVVVLAGDISHYNVQSYWILEYLSQHYQKVFFVVGNHDYYLINERQSKKYKHNSKNRVTELLEMLANLTNIVYLTDYQPYDYKGVTFAGATNWYSLKEPGEKVFYNTISNDSAAIKGFDIAIEHEKEMAAFKQLKHADILVTHIPIITLDSHNKYKSTYCYLNELLPKGKHHIFGHCHEQTEIVKANLHFHINAIGYTNEWTQHLPPDFLKKDKRIQFYKEWIQIKSFHL